MQFRRSPQPRPRTAIAVATAALLAASGCAAGDSSSDTVKISAGFYPLAWVAEEIGGEHVEVTNLTRPGKDAHTTEMSVRATAALAGADLVVVNGGFQADIDAAVKANASGAVLDVAKVLDFIPVSEAHDHSEDEHAEEEHAHEHSEDEHAHEHSEDEHAHEHSEDEHAEEEGDHAGHDHGDLDPHFWLDPVLMAEYGDHLADELAELDPENADSFRAAADDLTERLTQVDTDYTEQLASCRTDTVVVSHDAFGYLARYGLSFEAVAGLSPGAEPTPADLKHISEIIASEQLTTVFTETLAPTKLTSQLAADAGIRTAVLDPIEGLTDASSDDDYLSLMQANLAELTKANAC